MTVPDDSISTVIRPTDPSDSPQIVALLAETGLKANVQPADLFWKYWRERPDWPCPRSFVLARANDILAHAAIVPGVCAWNTGRLRTSHLIDWAARPSAAGAGVALMKHLSRLTDMQLAIGGSAQTQRILPHLGFRVVGTANVYVRTLHPLLIPRNAAGPHWRRLSRAARSLLWHVTAPWGNRKAFSVRRVPLHEIDDAATNLPIPKAGAALLERSKSLLQYILACPIAPMEFYVFEQHHEIKRGYFILAAAPAQMRLVDCWTSSEELQDWCNLIHCAVHEAQKHAEVAELIAWGSDPLLCAALNRCGFRPRGVLPIRVLSRSGLSIGAAALRVQMLDNDAAYQHSGLPELWA